MDSEQREFLPGSAAHRADQELVRFDVRGNAMEVEGVGAFGGENGSSLTGLHAL